jgi:hypothetical protein
MVDELSRLTVSGMQNFGFKHVCCGNPLNSFSESVDFSYVERRRNQHSQKNDPN